MNAHLPQPLPGYDELARLAHDDPEGYEAARQRIIDDYLDTLPEARQARLRGLQFRIECVRRLAKSPLGSTIRIYELMWKSFLIMNDNWQELAHPEAAPPVAPPPRQAQIIEFRPPCREPPAADDPDGAAR